MTSGSRPAWPQSTTRVAACKVADRSDLDKYATGAAPGGVLALLLGTRRGRRIGRSAIKLGSLAALGMLAHKTYNGWHLHQQPTAGPCSKP